MTLIPLNDDGKKLGIVTDLEACTGCHACAVNCKAWNTGAPLVDHTEIDAETLDMDGVWFNRVHSFQTGYALDRKTVHMPRSCLHCEIPACVEACPTGASFKREEDGIVLINADDCIGCKLCSWACPYGANEYDETENVMQKCTMCVDRIYDETLGVEDRAPACVTTCPVNARHFGDLADPASDVSRMVEERNGFDLIRELGYRPVNKYLPPDDTPGAPDPDARAIGPVPEDDAPVRLFREIAANLLQKTAPGHSVASAIVFMTLSGAGFGLLVWAAFFAFFKTVPPDRWFGFAVFFTAFAMITLGLQVSTAHLGHPERAWKVFSQWKSSWLSREGVFSTATYGPGLMFALGWVVFETYGDFWRLMSGLTTLLALGTVICTAMVYASLRPVRAWFNPSTIRVFISMALWSGVVWFNMLAQVYDFHTPTIGIILVITGIATLYFKRKYWIFLDTSPSWVSPASATGLDDQTELRQLAGPATEETFIHREMGYKLARRRIEQLRRRAFLLYFLLPFCAAAMPVEMDDWIKIPAAIIAVLSVMVGIMIERWLFFAEAKHTAMLYYGEETS